MTIQFAHDIQADCPTCLELRQVYLQLSPEEQETLAYWCGLSVITLLLAWLTAISLASLTVGGGLWRHRWLSFLVGWGAMICLWTTNPEGALWLTALVTVYHNLRRD